VTPRIASEVPANVDQGRKGESVAAISSPTKPITRWSRVRSTAHWPKPFVSKLASMASRRLSLSCLVSGFKR
jgi:hypothetical protein